MDIFMNGVLAPEKRPEASMITVTTMPDEKTITENTATIKPARKGIDYKWIALSNVTLASLMGTINGSIILISLPAIFKGIQINPMAPELVPVLLWILMGYGVVTATLLLTFGGYRTCTAVSRSSGWDS